MLIYFPLLFHYLTLSIYLTAGTFNLSSRGITECISWIARQDPPLLVLGGGGYNLSDAARCYATILAALTTSATVDSPQNVLQQITTMAIPEHDYFPRYGPDFQMNVKPVIHRKNLNSSDSLSEIIRRAFRHLVKYEKHHHVAAVKDTSP